MRRSWLGVVGAAIILLSLAPGLAAAAPGRVVSMNLCTDQLAMLLAAPGQLVSVSFLAHDPRSSAMAAEARRFPANTGQAEAIFRMKPDLVLAGTYTTRATVEMLRRLDIEVVEFAPATSLNDVRDRIAIMGAALKREQAARELIARFDAELAAMQVDGVEKPVAALYYANGFTVGSGALADSIVQEAGLQNLAAVLGLEGSGFLPLERLVFAEPHVIVTDDRFDTPAIAQEVFSHPALAALKERTASAPVADRYWVCGTPFVLEAIRRLVSARNALAAGR